MAIALSMLVLWNFVLLPPQVTAMELIERARVAEEAPLRVLSKASVQRMLQASRRVDGILQQQVEHEEVWDGVPGALHRVDARNTIVDELASAIPVPNCTGLSPLSAMMMRCLAADAGTQSRVVTQLLEPGSGFHQIAIDFVRPREGSPFTSIWHLRISDWQITKVDFHFFSYPQEVSYRVELLAQFVTEGAAVAATPRSEAVPSSKEELTPMAAFRTPKPKLTVTRLAVFQALQGLGVTPDDEIRIEDDAAGLRVEAIVPNDLRKWQIEQALHPLASVETLVYTYEDAAALPLRNHVDTMGGLPEQSSGSQPVTSVRGEGPLLQEALVEHFGGGEVGQEKVGFLSQIVLDATQDIAFKTRWLTRISAAFAPAHRQQLSREENVALRQLEEEIMREIAATHRGLGDRLRAELCPAMCNAMPLGTGRGDSFAQGSATTTGERSDVQTMLMAAIETEFVVLKTLFVDGGFSKHLKLAQENETLRASEAPSAIQSWLQQAEEVSARLETALKDDRPKRIQANR
jgi:hypothetical protein